MQIAVDWSSTFKPDKLDADMLKRGGTAMTKVVSTIRAKAQARLRPRRQKGAGLGGMFTHELRKGIRESVRLSHTEIEGRVTVGVPYGKYVEGWNSLNQHVPVRRHFVLFTTAPMLRVWAERKGLFKARGRKAAARGWSLSPNAKGMFVGGPDSITPFLEPAFLEVLPSAREILAGSITSG